MLLFPSGEPFATGMAHYAYQPVNFREKANRIILNVYVESIQTQAYLDTGAVYLVCSPEVATVLHLYGEESEKLFFRGRLYEGGLHRVSLTVPAEQGESATIDVTAFVPDIHPDEEWPLEFPCILGMAGCLERLRFAIDPFEDIIYFGVPTKDF